MPERNFIDDCINIYNEYCYPVLFGNLDRPAFWPVIVTAIIIFLAVSEIGSQSCENGGCGHYKNIYKTKNDVDRIISQIKLNHTTVGWRRALIIAMLLSLIILAIFYQELPDGFDFFLVATLLFLIIYFTSSWFQWHWWKARDFKIEKRLLELRHNIKEIQMDNDRYDNKRNYGNSSVMKHLDSILSSD